MTAYDSSAFGPKGNCELLVWKGDSGSPESGAAARRAAHCIEPLGYNVTQKRETHGGVVPQPSRNRRLLQWC